MTPDPSRPPFDPAAEPDPADLAASARLDGDTSFVAPPGLDADDVDRRYTELAQVRSWVGEAVEPPPADVVDAQIARALAAAEPAAQASESTEASGAGAIGAVPDVVPAPPIELNRRRRAGGSRRWLAVAAAVALLALGAAIVATHQPSSSSKFETVGAPVEGSSSSSGADAATRSQPDEQAQVDASPSTTASGSTAALPDLGAIGSEQALSAEVHQVTEPATATATTTPGPVTTTAAANPSTPTSTTTPSVELTPLAISPACDAALRQSDPTLGVLVYAATATYKGIEVEVLIYGTPADAPSSYRVIAVRTDTCSVLADLPY